MRTFAELTEKEILALAISLEEEHARIYADYAEGLRQDFPASARVFQEMAEEENEHRRRLIELYREKFGEHIPLVRRHDVKGFLTHEPLWIVRPLGLDKVRKQAEAIELETRRFYDRALARSCSNDARLVMSSTSSSSGTHNSTIVMRPR